MTDRTPTPNHPALRDAAQTRLEDLFDVQRPLYRDTPNVDVVVKRRRIASTDCRANGNDSGISEAGEPRKPRVFKVEKQHRQEGSQGQELHSNVDAKGTAQLALTLVTFTPAQVRPRRRRRLNGEVTIIRPTQDGNPVHQGPLRVSAPRSSIEGSQALDLDVDRFGVDPKLLRQQRGIQVRIAELKRQAETARKVEKAAAIRWINNAIKRYGIEARDIGF